VQPESTEEDLEINETIQNLEEAVEPDGSQMTISGQPAGDTSEYASAWPEWLMREQLEAAGILNQPP
jgi:hypothetical protein